jgi:DNA-binding transcriptional regulator LsrR (DeoR family)
MHEHARRVGKGPQHVSEPDHYGVDQLRQVAKWFYRETPKPLTKRQIAARLHIEIRAVTRMLKQARQQNIVRIEIPETVECGEEHELKRWFPHLQEIIAVPTADQYSELLNLWGVEAARYFDKVTERGTHHVGVSGGETLLNFCESIGTRRRENIHIHTTALIGRGVLAPSASHVDPNVTATILWSRCGRLSGHCHFATVPSYDEGVTRKQIAEELKALVQRKPIREVIKRMDDITLAFAGLGLVNPKAAPRSINQLTMTGLLGPIVSPAILAQEGAFADLAYCLLDRSGQTRKDWTFFLTAGHCDDNPLRRGLGFFKQMVDDGKSVVVIAGTRKQDAIRAALKARAFNVWITDRKTLAQVHAAEQQERINAGLE